MPRILIACWGSHGDVDPYIGLGLGLQSRGCRVTLAAPAHYREFIANQGLGFLAIPPDVEPHDEERMARIMDPNDGTRYVLRELVFPATEAMYSALETEAELADLIVSHPLTAPAAFHAERLGKPWISTALAPLSFFSEYELSVMAPAPWLKSLEFISPWPSRWFQRLGKRMTATWPAPVYQLRQRLGLADRGNPIFEGQHSPYGVLALWSKVLGAPQPDWPQRVSITGPMFYDTPHGSVLAPELDAFLSAGDPPIVFTLGSSAVHRAGDFWQQSLDAVSRLGRRAVFLMGQTAKSTFETLVPNVFSIDRAPHSLLMPRAAAIVHQCGVGTLAQSLRSGRPVLAVPFAHDQYDNAWRISRLGMALTLASHRYTARRAARALGELLESARFTEAAESVAHVVREERGVAAACDVILRVLEEQGSYTGPDDSVGPLSQRGVKPASQG